MLEFPRNYSICHLAALKLLSNWLKATRAVIGHSICHKRTLEALGEQLSLTTTMFNYRIHTFRVLSGIHKIFLRLGKFFMRFNMMTHSDTSEHFIGSTSKSSRIFGSNMGRASNPQLTSATFCFQAVTILNLSIWIQCRVSPSNYDCGRAAFTFDGIPYRSPRWRFMPSDDSFGPCHILAPPACKIFLLIFVLFHFSCKWIAAVVLWDCSHHPLTPPPQTLPSSVFAQGPAGLPST